MSTAVHLKNHYPVSEPAETPSLSGYEVRALTRKEFPCWEQFVRHSPQGTIFHSALWLDAAGMPYRLFGCFRGAELRGGFAVGLLRERVARPIVLTPYLGILFPKSDAKYVTTISANKEIATQFALFLKREFDSVQLRFPPEVVDLQPFIWEGFQASVRYTYRLRVTHMNAAWEAMDARRRNDIRSAEKAGITVEQGNALTRVLELSESTFRRQRIELTFRKAAERFEAAVASPARSRSFIARNRVGQDIGAAYIVWDEKRAYYLLGGYDSQAEKAAACSLALWQAIRFTAEELKLPEFDFEGSMIPAVEGFFRKFGGTLTPTYSVLWERPSFSRDVLRVAKRIRSLLRF